MTEIAVTRGHFGRAGLQPALPGTPQCDADFRQQVRVQL